MTQHNTARRFRGLVLFELLVTIASIAVVVGILLPANQKKRESANRSECHSIVRQLGIALATYEADMGRYPRLMATGNLTGSSFWELHAEKLGLRFGPGDETLIGAGYEFSYNGGSKFFELVATPVAPGLTASTTQSIDDRSVFFDRDRILVKVREEPTPGADENRDLALAAIRDCGKASVALLLLEDGTADDANLVKFFVRDETEAVFKDLDSNKDRTVTFVEILGKHNDRLPAQLLACITDQLQIGAGVEQIEDIPGVLLQDLAGNPADLFSFQEVCDSTIIATQRAGVAGASCKKLDAAESAELRGKFKTRNNILSAYQSLVSAQSGKAIPDHLADELMMLAEILKSEQK